MARRRRTVLTACAAAAAVLAGCSGEDSDPIEADAASPAHLPRSALEKTEYEETLSETTTVETTVRASIEGDVEMSASRDVIAMVFRRGYAAGDRRFGLITAPIVDLIEGQDLSRDPIGSVADAEVVRLATGVDAVEVGEWTERERLPFLGDEEPVSGTTVAGGDGNGEFAARRAHAAVDSDGVTALALAPVSADGPELDPPFNRVSYDG